MRFVFAIAMLVPACGRGFFDPIHTCTDGSTVGDTSPMIDAVQVTTFAQPVVIQVGATAATNSTVTLAIAPTEPGHLLVVAIASFNSAEAVTAVGDDAGNSYVTTNESSLSSNSECEIWFVKSSLAGATTIHVTWAAVTSGEIWFAEVKNMDTTDPFDVGAVMNNGTITPQLPAPQVTPTTPISFIMSVEGGNGSVQRITSAVPLFAAILIEIGNDAAYFIATEPGTYGATWDDSSAGPFNASTAAFKPATL